MVYFLLGIFRDNPAWTREWDFLVQTLELVGSGHPPHLHLHQPQYSLIPEILKKGVHIWCHGQQTLHSTTEDLQYRRLKMTSTLYTALSIEFLWLVFLTSDLISFSLYGSVSSLGSLQAKKHIVSIVKLVYHIAQRQSFSITRLLTSASKQEDFR